MSKGQTIEFEDKPAPPAHARTVTELGVSGMTCGNCARHVTEAIQSVPGVRSATVNLETERASVRWAPETPTRAAALIEAIEAAGFGAKEIEPQARDAGEHRLAGWHLNLWVAVLGTIPLMLGEWIFGLGATPWFGWLSFALASIVQVFAGARFYRGAWNQLKVGSSSMDTLVALGSTTAFAYSVWALLSGSAGHLYFMEAAAIIALISVGHWLESRVNVRAADAVRRLLRLAPAVARRRNADASESEVPVAELKAGDLVALRPGERVPTDGEVVEGESVVDESMLTGEATPVDKRIGSPLYAGTVNLNGRLLLRVTATGEETALAHIIAAVQRAQTSRARIQRLADRVSNVFVPIVIAVAIGAGLWWGLAPEQAHRVARALSPYLWPVHAPTPPLAAAFIIAASVLIIACPCAMGLATPAAIMASANAAAQRGILIRDGLALEKAGEITAVLFDKTGTLTTGKLEVTEIWPGSTGDPPVPSGDSPDGTGTTIRGNKAGLSKKGVTAVPVGNLPVPADDSPALHILASALARHSSHPISQALARLSTEKCDLAEWSEVPGSGVQATIEHRRFDAEAQQPGVGGSRGAPDTARLGSLRWLSETDVDLASGKAFIEQWSDQGATIVGLAIGKSLCGLFAVKDTLKLGAREVIERLHRQGSKTYLVTGDNARTAASIARQAGIPVNHVFAEIRPEQKAALVKQLQQQRERVAFVGDGINDAPALEQADLGVAVSRASDIAREAADIILLKSEIEAVPESLGLARATLRTIKQNLFWAFFYNAIGIPLAALGFMSPILCAAAMGLSDLVVIGNALRLRRWRL